MANRVLEDYVRENLGSGVPPAAIREELEKAGWKSEDIGAALEAKPAKAPQPPQSMREKVFSAIRRIPTIQLLLLAAVVLAALGGAAYYAYSFLQASASSIPAVIGGNETIEAEGTPQPVSPSLPAEFSPTPIVLGNASARPTYSVPPVAVNTPTPKPAMRPPQIFAVSNHSITSGSAAISWTTDAASSSRLIYGTVSLNRSVEYNESTTSHYLKITGLESNTTYQYAVESCIGLACRYAETESFKTLPFSLSAQDVDRLEVNPPAPTIYANTSIQFSMTAVFKNGSRTKLPANILGWNASNSSVGRVNATSGFFQPLSSGKVKISGLLVNATIDGGEIDDYWNSSDVTIQKAVPRLAISISPANLVDYGKLTTASCQSSTAQVKLQIVRNNLFLGGTSDSLVLPVGTTTYSCYSNETANYSSAVVSGNVVVRKVPAEPKMLINGSEWTADKTWNVSKGFYYANFSYSGATFVSTSSECSFNAFCTVLATGSFSFTAYSAGDENHSSNTVTRYLNVIP